MTKELYIKIKHTADVVYEYYKEFSNGKLLGYQEFFVYINMWGDINELHKKVTQHYNQQFELVALLDNEGKLIKYL
jgi:hypothetical protein